MSLNPLKRRIIELSYKHKLTHVSSCLNTVDVIDEIYAAKKKEEPFVLGNSHASLALFAVLEKYGYCDAEQMMLKHGTHACRDMEHGVWVSGGSLGQAETVAVGLALADPTRTVWLVTSDGACMEGCVTEALRCVGRYGLHRFMLTIIYNGLGAYGPIRMYELRPFAASFECPVNIHEVDQSEYPEWLKGLPGHYLQLSKEQAEELLA